MSDTSKAGAGTDSSRSEVIRQEWWESERGWGHRPDGYSLHLSEDDRKAFIADYWARQPNAVPATYSLPIGDPQTVQVDLSTYRLIKLSKNGLRRYDEETDE